MENPEYFDYQVVLDLKVGDVLRFPDEDGAEMEATIESFTEEGVPVMSEPRYCVPTE